MRNYSNADLVGFLEDRNYVYKVSVAMELYGRKDQLNEDQLGILSSYFKKQKDWDKAKILTNLRTGLKFVHRQQAALVVSAA